MYDLRFKFRLDFTLFRFELRFGVLAHGESDALYLDVNLVFETLEVSAVLFALAFQRFVHLGALQFELTRVGRETFH